MEIKRYRPEGWETIKREILEIKAQFPQKLPYKTENGIGYIENFNLDDYIEAGADAMLEKLRDLGNKQARFVDNGWVRIVDVKGTLTIIPDDEVKNETMSH